jgi:hypothetical protein
MRSDLRRNSDEISAEVGVQHFAEWPTKEEISAKVGVEYFAE